MTLASAARRHRVVMLLENNTYPDDVRVRREAHSLVTAGNRVVVWAPRGAGQARRELLGGVHVRRFPLPRSRGGRAGFLLEYAVAGTALHAAAAWELARGATVLHLHNPPDILFGAGLLARLARRKVVFDHHDLFPELAEAKFGSATLVRLARVAERATFAVSDAVLAANLSHAQIARGRGRRPARAVTVVRNGPLAASLWATPVHRPGPLKDPLLVYVGAASTQDGVEGLAPVLASMAAEHRLVGVRLTIVGDGDQRDEIDAAMRRAGVADRVSWTGWISPEEVLEHVRAADICVDPAPPGPLNDRSTMIKIAEYMAAGRPVAAYELLETGRTLGGAGLMAPAGDPAALARACARLAADDDLRVRLGARASARAAELVWEHSERNLLEAYSRL